MGVEFELTLDDWKAFVKHVYGRIGAAAMSRSLNLTIGVLVYIPLGMALAGAYHYWSDHRYSDLHHFYMTLAFFAVWVGAVVGSHTYRYSAFLKKSIASDGSFTQRQMLRIDEKGVTVTKSDSHQAYEWSAIKELALADRAFYFYLDTNAALVVPKQTFSTDSDAQSFFRQAMQLMSASKVLRPTA